MVIKSVPPSSRCVAKECRNACMLPFFLIPAFAFAFFMISSMLRVLYWPPKGSKDYVRSAFGFSSPEFKLVTKLQFKKLVKVD